MAKSAWTKRSAFGHFGAVAKNHVWSWSARSPDGKTIVLALWEDMFDEEDGQLIYDTFGHKDLEMLRTGNGNKDRVHNLEHARDACGGRFRVVKVTAKDTEAHPRDVLRRHPDETLVMEIVGFDPYSGAFRARSVSI
jgi:hypothetical protein